MSIRSALSALTFLLACPNLIHSRCHSTRIQSHTGIVKGISFSFMGTACPKRVLNTIPCLPPDSKKDVKVKPQASLNSAGRAQSQDQCQLLLLLLAKDRIRRKPRSSTCAPSYNSIPPRSQLFGYLCRSVLCHLAGTKTRLRLISEKREIAPSFIIIPLSCWGLLYCGWKAFLRSRKGLSVEPAFLF